VIGFVSPLAEDFVAFLDFKRSRDCKYARAEKWLRAFDRFVFARARRPKDVRLDVLIPKWLGRNAARTSVTVANELIVIRKFCEFRQRRDPKAYVPTARWAPQSSKSEFKPYIFTDEEIARVLQLSADLNHPRFRARLYRALLLVLICTGIRIGEALRLRMRDVDLERGVVFIAESKGRARWVPFSSSLKRELRAYMEARLAYAPAVSDHRFFVGADAERLRFNAASETMRSLFRRAGIKPGAGRVGPRIHDLRHTFAVHRLARWHRAGLDAQARLPLLSAYMGHVSILGTEKYLHATPELLQIAAGRLKRRLMETRSCS
jgi:integrase/recombinase XerD